MGTGADWTKGKHTDYSAFVMELHVRRDRDGSLRTRRLLQDEEDRAVAQSMGNSGGLEEGAWALLTEATRAETLLQLLVKLSNDPQLQEKFSSDPASFEDVVARLTKDTLEQMTRGLDTLVPSLARETAETVRDGFRRKAG